MKLHKYTEEELRVAVASSKSIRSVLKKLGVASYGGNYFVFHKAVKEFAIDTAHFTGNGWNKGGKAINRIETDALLVDGSTVTSHKLRLRLLKEGYFESRCQKCGITHWQESPVSLELHHVNNKRSDNRLENLTILCPNCHALSHKS